MKGTTNKESFIVLMAVCIMCSFLCIYHQSEGELYGQDFIRFHVVANSNSDEDQALKLKVRDAVLREVSPDLSKMKSVKESRQWITDNSERINILAENIIREEGADYTTKTELGQRWIPKKSYGNITLPAGNYEAFTIEIGEAKGENWWCVMFPPICIIGEEPDEYTDEISEEFEGTKYEEMIGYCNEETPYVLKFKTTEICEKFINLIKK